MIENLIAKTIDCECGKPHRSNVDYIFIKEGVVEKELLDFIRANNYNKITLVCDKKGYEICGERTYLAVKNIAKQVKVHLFTDDELVPDERAVGNLIMGAIPDSDIFLAVGSGVVNDLTRYASAVKGIPFITVGIAPSMDGYISGSSALIYNGLKLTFETHAPKAVFFEPSILSNAPRDMIASGVGDLLGKINCLTDWKLSKIINNEWHCDYISNLVQAAIDKTFEAKEGIIAQEDQATALLLEALLISGVCMDYAGNSRPASGAEHHLSHFLEMRYIIEGRKAVFHGTKVGIGTIITLKAYDYASKLNPDFNKIKALKRTDYSKWEEEIKKAFLFASDEIIDLEKKSGKNDINNINKRLGVIEEKWQEIKDLMGSITKPQEVKDFLEKLSAPVYPHQIGVDKVMARQAITYAKEIRNRYTVLQLLYDLGELDNFVDLVIEEYYGEK